MIHSRGGKPDRDRDESRFLRLEQFERIFLAKAVLAAGDENAAILQQSRGVPPA